MYSLALKSSPSFVAWQVAQKLLKTFLQSELRGTGSLEGVHSCISAQYKGSKKSFTEVELRTFAAPIELELLGIGFII